MTRLTSATSRPRRRLGFTLIELLVVIAIVSILIVLLLPKIAQVREQARRSICAGNLHQWYLVAENYATDNDEYYPGVWNSRDNKVLAIGFEPDGPNFPAEHGPEPEFYEWGGYWDPNTKYGSGGPATLPGGYTLPASVQMETHYGFLPHIRKCPSSSTEIDDMNHLFESIDPWHAPGDYYGWFGRGAVRSGGYIGRQGINNTDKQIGNIYWEAGIYGWGNNVIKWRRANVLYSAQWGGWNVGENFGPFWNRLVPRNGNALMAADKHFPVIKGAYASQYPSIDSNHPRPNTKRVNGRLAADGANELLVAGSVEWMGFGIGQELWPIGADGTQEFWANSPDHTTQYFPYTVNWKMARQAIKPFIVASDGTPDP